MTGFTDKLRIAPRFMCAGLLALTLAGVAQAGLPVAVAGTQLPSLAPMLDKVKSAIVNISTESRQRVRENPLLRDPFFRRFFNVPNNQPRYRRSQSLGSGVIVDAAKGYVITNNHVVDKADEITVTLGDGRTFKAKLVGSDAESDVAVVRIPAEQLTAIPIGDSDKLRVGDFVVAIGNPFGLSQTVTSGIVSALGRSGLGIEGYEDFIQTDASINPGNSGGALVNLRGELVGVNTAILAPSGGNVGIGFAIPINMVHQLRQQLVQYGEVQRGRLGVMIQDLTPDLAQAFGISQNDGAVVSQVIPGSAAAEAGIKEGDVVLSVNGREIRSSADLRNTIGLMRPGSGVTLGIIRDGKRETIKTSIKTAQTRHSQGARITAKLEGAVFNDYGEDGDEAERGVQIVDIEQGSPAWQAGLRKGDIIVSVNRERVTSVAQLRATVRSGGGALLLNIQRGDGALFLVIR